MAFDLAISLLTASPNGNVMFRGGPLFDPWGQGDEVAGNTTLTWQQPFPSLRGDRNMEVDLTVALAIITSLCSLTLSILNRQAVRFLSQSTEASQQTAVTRL